MKRKRSFWRWLILWARAESMAEARRKQIMRENLEAWNRNNRDFISECEKEDDKRIYSTSADETSTIGHYGSDCGDGASS